MRLRAGRRIASLGDMPSARAKLPWWARAADLGAIALLALALFVAIDGGFVLRPEGPRLSVRSEWRVLLWAGALVIARHLFVRHHPLHRRVISGIAAASRAGGPLRDDLPDLSSPPARRQRFLTYTTYTAAVVIFYGVMTAVMTYPQVTVLGTSVSLDHGDPLFSTWRLAWVAHQVVRDPMNLFNANIFHPELRTLAFSDAMLVPALMAAPLLWLGVPQLIVYNVTLLSAFAFSGAGMFVLVRSLTRHVGAALFAGFVFAFLPYRFMHYSHLELQFAHWMPLCLWAFHKTIRSGRLRDGLLTGLFFALQTLSSWYYGIFLFTFMVPVGLGLLIGEGTKRLALNVRAFAAGGLLAAMLIVPMALPYFAARESVGERPLVEIEFYSASGQNYLAAHSSNVLFGRLTAKWGGQERELFMGILVPLLALVGLWPVLSAARIAYAFGLVVAFDVSLGFNGVVYPWLHEYVLPYRGLRVPARMAMVVGLALSTLAGYGIARLLRSIRSRTASIAALVLLTSVVALEYRSKPALKAIWTSPPPIYDALPAGTRNVLLELPLLIPDIAIEPVYMYFSTFHWNTLINGYSGFSPPSYYYLREAMEAFPDSRALDELHRRGVTHVVVHAAFCHRGVYNDLVARIEASQRFERIATTLWERQEIRLYRLLDTWRTSSPVGVN
jgi:hypothetical protein